MVPVRFIGVDGPRWFLRAMIVGSAAVESAKAVPFERLLREVVVVRGTEALPSREHVPLRLPKEVISAAAEATATGDGAAVSPRSPDEDT
jgi:hypothetical protein